MKENQSDLLMLCIATFGITYVHIWGLVLPYYASYCYMIDKTIRVNQIYGTFLFYLIGQLFASAVVPYLFKIFGISLMYLFFSLIELSMGFWSIYYIQPFQVCVVLFFKGFLYQCVQTAGNVILTEKFEGGILKVKYLNTSRLCSSFVFLFFIQFKMNPNNHPQDLKSVYGEYFFHKDIAENFAFCSLACSIASALFLILPYFFVNNPKNFRNNFLKFIKYLCGKSNFNFATESIALDSVSINSSQIYIEQSEKYNSINRSISQIKEDLVKKGQSYTIEDKLVHMFGLIIMIHLCIAYYEIDNYKYIALVLNFKDNYITFGYFCSTFCFISSNYILTYIWNKYGFDVSVLILNLLSIVNLTAIILSQDFFILQILLARIGSGWLLLLQDLFCYSFFDSFEAMKKTKLMTFYCFLGDLIQVVLNFAIFREEHYKIIFVALFLLNIISLFVQNQFLKNKIRLNKQKRLIVNYLNNLFKSYKKYFQLSLFFQYIIIYSTKEFVYF